MYRMNEMEFWNGRRHELGREAEEWTPRRQRVARKGSPDSGAALRGRPGTPPRAEQRTGMRGGEYLMELRVFTSGGAETALEESVIGAFGTRLRGELLRPGDAGYEEARKSGTA